MKNGGKDVPNIINNIRYERGRVLKEKILIVFLDMVFVPLYSFRPNGFMAIWFMSLF